MSGFKIGDTAVFLGQDGIEREMIIDGFGHDGAAMGIMDIGDGTSKLVRRDPRALMRKKGPFFDIRGQVYTTSSSHSDQIGEIIALGKSKSEKLFYKVRFADDAVVWFSEDQVFLETAASDK